MGIQDKSGVSWTSATWNPIVGCRHISAGCDNCWAEKAAKLHYHSEFPNGWDDHVKLFPERLDWPLHRRKPLRIAVGLMGDLFHEQVPDEFIGSIIGHMAMAQQHTYQILTKRPKRMLEYFRRMSDSFPHMCVQKNLCLGVSCENQTAADERIPILLKAPAAVRFISLEPLLGPINLFAVKTPDGDGPGNDLTWIGEGAGIDWVIVGGESGPGARPMHPDWVRSLSNQCQTAEVPFHFKQWGEWVPGGCVGIYDIRKKTQVFLDRTRMLRVGKKVAGRMLDGHEWLEFPKAKDFRK
jgi:protein gp37